MQKEIQMKKLLIILIIGTLLLFPALLIFADSFDGVNYTVIKKSNMGTIKSLIIIRLEKKVSKDFLEKLALKLRKAEPRKYDRMFIHYYLPGMKPNFGAWATSDFDPNLKVQILGTTIEEEKALINDNTSLSGEKIGEWFDDSAGAGIKYTLLKRNNKIILVRKGKKGSEWEEEMIQKKQSGRLKFEEKRGNNSGDYFLIEKNGNLGVYDNAGFIFTMPPIK